MGQKKFNPRKQKLLPVQLLALTPQTWMHEAHLVQFSGRSLSQPLWLSHSLTQSSIQSLVQGAAQNVLPAASHYQK
ncbi:hypothetical protein L6452_00924 [Arctium lappa]|uniref:Uncharacterized protein n=1 Tax=Arctium lappa TaxID=4217 RepID=A0ACB9FGK4_ARCLA|nr:hypothetical protein L6452_00924 [Arctium lappa]